MEDKKKRTTNTTITRNTAEFSQMTDNIYETVAMLTLRSNQIAIDVKKELHKKIEEFKNIFKNIYKNTDYYKIQY